MNPPPDTPAPILPDSDMPTPAMRRVAARAAALEALVAMGCDELTAMRTVSAIAYHVDAHGTANESRP